MTSLPEEGEEVKDFVATHIEALKSVNAIGDQNYFKLPDIIMGDS